ncbi:MAG: hypothetical protein EBU46_12230 [Nitrosomonadaceae bacterium]|nr:hypothetical protein [Nitrosomonadaceae bacterium]
MLISIRMESFLRDRLRLLKMQCLWGGGAYSAQDFIYTITGPNGFNQTFTLDDDGGADATFSNQQVFFGLAEGVYTITESPVANWEVTNIAASENGVEDTTSSDIFSTSLPSKSIQITVANGEVWTSTFTNKENVPPIAELAITKKVLGVYNSDDTVDSDSTVDSAGDYILYEVAISNPGTLTLTNVVVSDPLLGGTIDTLATFAIGDKKTYTDLKYVVKQSDLDNNGGGDGDIDNTATADSNETAPVSDSQSVPLEYAPALDIIKKNAGVKDEDGNGQDAGDTITYNYTVTNIGNISLLNAAASDDKLGGLTLSGLTDIDGDGDADDLAVGASATASATATLTQAQIDAGSVTNIATGKGTGTNGKDVEDSDTNTVKIIQDPKLTVEKYVSVDGGNTWDKADSPTGPTMVNTAGMNPLFKFEVTNTGNVTLHDVVLTDDGGTSSTTGDDTTFNIGTLNVGGSWIYGDDVGEKYELLWKPGQQVNWATADSTETNPVVTDPAYYFGAMSALVTNSELCTFGDNFNLIFTPDYSLGSGNYKLSDSNPGQFYYNMFDHGVKGETKTYTFEIPKPFVPQGAVPVHIYDSVHIDTEGGQYCLTPGSELANYKLTDLIKSDTDNDGNIEYTFSATFANDTDLYLNMHLDYGLEKQTGWSKSVDALGNENAVDNPNVAGVQPNILEKTNYEFSASINNLFQSNSVDSIFNDNVFKNLKGVGGFAHTAGTHDPIGGQNMILLDSKGAKVGLATTDADGWEFMTVSAPSKSASYTAFWDQDKDGVKDVTEPYQNITWGGPTKFVEVNFDYIVGSNPTIDILL